MVQVLRGFVRSGGLTLAAAVAHHMLLSAIPLLMVTLVLFSRFVEPGRLAAVLTAELSHLLPRPTAVTIVDNALAFEEAPQISGGLGLISLLVFSTLAFRTLHSAIAVISGGRERESRRSLLSSALLSLAFVLAIGFFSAVLSLALVGLDDLPPEVAQWLAPAGFAASLIGLTVVLSAVYLVMPVGRVKPRHALTSGLFVALSWTLLQQLLLYYLETLSPVNWIFGSMATVIVVLISFEALAAIVLLGAQAVTEVGRAR